MPQRLLTHRRSVSDRLDGQGLATIDETTSAQVQKRARPQHLRAFSIDAGHAAKESLLKQQAERPESPRDARSSGSPVVERSRSKFSFSFTPIASAIQAHRRKSSSAASASAPGPPQKTTPTDGHSKEDKKLGTGSRSLPNKQSLRLNVTDLQKPKPKSKSSPLSVTSRASPPLSFKPSTSHHSFLIDEPSLQNMERGLLGLLDDFHQGRLKAFVANDTVERMRKIREKQETLAKLHFDLYAQHEQKRLHNDSMDSNGGGHQLSAENLKLLTENLSDLNSSIRDICMAEGFR